MDAQQAQILLEKINALWRSINASHGPVSAIERDLMLSYIRQLYNVFLDFNQLQSLPAVPPPPQQRPTPVPPPPVTETPVAPPPAPAPVQPAPKPQPVVPPPPQVVVPPPAPKPQAAAPATPPPPPPAARSVAGFESLFGVQQSNDLSNKLSKQPIADLTKAFAINDKLLYINDLFKKDKDAFAENVRQLNSFDNFEQAKARIVQLAQQNQWMDEERVETAQAFVQLVHRRYLA